MTFSNFMRHYLYYPLGGNRVNTQRRLFFNLWLVFLVSGLWHGASWNFVLYENGKRIDGIGLNEITLQKSNHLKLIKINTYINKKLLDHECSQITQI